MVPFSEVPVGTVFIADNITHVRIEPVYNEYGSPSNALAFSKYEKSLYDKDGKFVCRINGSLFWYSNKDLVQPDYKMTTIDGTTR